MSALDGLRALAVGLVLLFHAWNQPPDWPMGSAVTDVLQAHRRASLLLRAGAIHLGGSSARGFLEEELA